MTAEGRAGVACVAAGVAWLALVPVSALDVSAGAYRTVLAVAVAVLAVAWLLLGLAWRPRESRARMGSWLVLGGLVAAAAGAPFEAGGLFVLGVFALLVGGPTAAVALRRSGLPFWALALVCLVGFGVLFGDLFRESSLLAAVLGLGAFAAGWIALGVLLSRRPYAFSSTPT